MARAYIDDDEHKKVKQYAASQEKGISETYNELIDLVIDESGNMKDTILPEEHPRVVTLELSEGEKELVEDISKEKNISEEEVIKNMVEISMDEIATDDYFLIDKINNRIETRKKEISELEEILDKLKGE